jgi:hypothetical protein
MQSQQLTIVELLVPQLIDKEIEITFYCPNDTVDMSNLLGAMNANNGAVINEALDAWGCRLPDEYSERSLQVPIKVVPIVEEENRALSGFETQVSVKIPSGHCTVSAAWAHNILSKGGMNYLMIPTQNESLQGWRMEAVVIAGDTSPYGMPQKRSLSRALRWDLAATQCYVYFSGNLDEATLVTQKSGALPFHNLWFPIVRKTAVMTNYLTVAGAEIHDDTELHLVTYYDVGFQPVIAAAGCVIRDGLNYINPKIHIPLLISERMTRRLGPLVWSDGPRGSHCIIGKIGDRTLKVDLLDREKFGGVTWVTAKNDDAIN